jgi:hypothetical protein
LDYICLDVSPPGSGQRTINSIFLPFQDIKPFQDYKYKTKSICIFTMSSGTAPCFGCGQKKYKGNIRW